jgi:hydroxymethylbilane synthase
VKLRIGTRGSALAMSQSRWVGRRLEARGHEFELVIIKTAGDRHQDRPFAEIGAPGVFVREIERALIEERIDLAVHSYKDLPSENPDELVVAAVPERLDPADRLIAHPDASMAGAAIPLVKGARVGTASARRQALLRELRPDLEIVELRGNVPTRLSKVPARELDAVILASAGLMRLRRDEEAGVDLSALERLIVTRLDPETFVPAPTQGALALQVRRSDSAAVEAVGSLNDETVARPVQAERRFLQQMGAGCQSPLGAWCRGLDDGTLEMVVTAEAGDGLYTARFRGEDPGDLAAVAHEDVKAKARR